MVPEIVPRIAIEKGHEEEAHRQSQEGDGRQQLPKAFFFCGVFHDSYRFGAVLHKLPHGSWGGDSTRNSFFSLARRKAGDYLAIGNPNGNESRKVRSNHR